MPPRAPQLKPKLPVLDRLYIISRDNINLASAQEIVQHAAMNHELGEVLISRVVPLVWCAAYPNELLGDAPLPALLLGYIKQQEGEKYMNKNSSVMPVEGKLNGYDYYLLALVH